MKCIFLQTFVTLFCSASILHAAPQGTAFTYQGVLLDGTGPANGQYVMQFRLFDAVTNGSAVGSPVVLSPVAVSNGLFHVQLDFGAAAFSGDQRWLDISVRTNDPAVTTFATLHPRQSLTAQPYAIRAAHFGGLIADTQLSPNVALLNVPNSLTNPANIIAGNGAGLTSLNAAQLTSGVVPATALSNAWRLIGNGGTTAGTHFVGTTDNQALELRVNNQRALRLEPGVTPNLIAGVAANVITPGRVGGVIAGGAIQSIEADYGTIGGGQSNIVRGLFSMIGGGQNNMIEANAHHAAIAGGKDNRARGVRSFVGGGELNSIRGAESAAIVGGQRNMISSNAAFSTITGGLSNRVGTNSYSGFVGGGTDNNIEANASSSAIVGGGNNRIGMNSTRNFVRGGDNNNIAPNSLNNHIGGGAGNHVGTNSNCNTIGGGRSNDVGSNCEYNSVAGIGNIIGTNSHRNTIAGGGGNIIGHNSSYATIPGGSGNYATNHAFAAGSAARAIHSGAFVWGDDVATPLSSTNANSVTMRATGGYRLLSDAGATVGAFLAPGGGAWAAMSDRSAKENFEPVDTRAMLDKVAALPMSTWNYKSQSEDIRHIGPMAQDFKAAFGVGEAETTITSIDADGVALAAIQGLNQKLQEELKRRDAENAELKQRLARLEELLLGAKTQ